MKYNSPIYSVVDIEATGSDPSKDKIIECAVVNTNGKEILDTYSTLIDPCTPIPAFITGITGITSEMVAGAPTFFQVADEIARNIDDTIFVAHNVTFDYNFLKGELSNCGIEISLPTICSCRTARKLLKGYSSYSLQNLTYALQIRHQKAHRALDDAMATAELFHIMYERTEGDLDRFRSDHTDLPASCPVPADKIKTLPNAPGIVWFNDVNGNPLHVSKARNIKQRAVQKLRKFTAKRFRTVNEEICSIDHEVTGNFTMARIREAEFILRFEPRYNHRNFTGVLTVDERYMKRNKIIGMVMSDGVKMDLIRETGPSSTQDTLFLLKEHQIMGYLNIDNDETIVQMSGFEDRFIMI